MMVVISSRYREVTERDAITSQGSAELIGVARHSRNSFREFGENRGETTEVFR
jgi:hypothetical protein